MGDAESSWLTNGEGLSKRLCLFVEIRTHHRRQDHIIHTRQHLFVGMRTRARSTGNDFFTMESL